MAFSFLSFRIVDFYLKEYAFYFYTPLYYSSIFGYNDVKPSINPSPSRDYPISAREAYETLKKYKIDPDPFNYPLNPDGSEYIGARGRMNTPYIKDTSKELYLPLPVDITITKE